MQPVGDGGGTELNADAWLDVAVEPRRVRHAWARNWSRLLLGLVTWDSSDIGYVRQPCRVVVTRRDTGVAVASFDHDSQGEGLQHLADLRTHLASMRLFDFARDVGIAYDAVADAIPSGDGKALAD